MTDEPLLDDDVLGQLFELSAGDHADFANEIIEDYLRDTPAAFVLMKEALAKQDADQLHKLAHSVKGSSGVLGAVSMAGLCATLEERGRNGSIEGAADLIARVESEFSRTARALRARKQK